MLPPCIRPVVADQEVGGAPGVCRTYQHLDRDAVTCLSEVKSRRPRVCQWRTNPKNAPHKAAKATAAISTARKRWAEQPEEHTEPSARCGADHGSSAEAATAGHLLDAVQVTTDDPYVLDRETGIGEPVDDVLGERVAVGRHQRGVSAADTLRNRGLIC